MGGVEVRRLGGVHAGAASHGDVPVEAAVDGESYRLFEGDVGRLDVGLVEEDSVDALVSQGVEGGGNGLAVGEVWISDDHHAPRAEAARLEADLAGDARPELDAGGVYREGGLESSLSHRLTSRADVGWVGRYPAAAATDSREPFAARAMEAYSSRTLLLLSTVGLEVSR